jgi:hypothetical protein
MDDLDQSLDVARQVGPVGLIVALGLVLVAHSRGHAPGHRRQPLALGGVALAAAALVAIAMSDDGAAVTGTQVLGVSVAGIGAQVASWIRLPVWARPLLVLPGAALTVDAMEIVRPAVVGPTIVATAVLAVLVAETDRIHAATAAGPPLLAASIFGMYASIPETGTILPVLIVAIPIGAVGGPLRVACLGTAGAEATVVLLAAVVAQGGQHRPASIVGGLATLGVLALEPLARALARRVRPAPENWRSPRLLGLSAMHVIVVFVAARVAGLRHDLRSAVLIVMATAGLALAVLIALDRDAD